MHPEALLAPGTGRSSRCAAQRMCSKSSMLEVKTIELETQLPDNHIATCFPNQPYLLWIFYDIVAFFNRGKQTCWTLTKQGGQGVAADGTSKLKKSGVANSAPFWHGIHGIQIFGTLISTPNSLWKSDHPWQGHKKRYQGSRIPLFGSQQP